MRLFIAVVLLFSSALVYASKRQAPQKRQRDYVVSGETQRIPVRDSDVEAVIQAIEDEIYDYGYQGFGFDYAGKPVQQGEYRLPVYFRPYLGRGKDLGEVAKGEGFVIYKYPPFGEVFRLFTLEKGGLAVVYGNPEFGFPPTHPNFLTLFMDDDEVCQYKHDWVKAYFVVDLKPSAERLHQAAERQVQRIGRSVRLSPDSRIVPEGQDPRCPTNSGGKKNSSK